jgi:ribose-phosphate pyrophosphokinase
MNAYTLSQPPEIECEVVRLLGSELELAEWKSFPSGELHVCAKNVEEDVIVIGRTYPPGGNLVATLLLLDTLRRNGAREITLILPYYAYGRQDRLEESGECVSGLFVAQQLAAAGASRIITADVHSQRIAEASPIPIVSVDMAPTFAVALASRLPEATCTVVSPDAGGRQRAQALASTLGVSSTAWVEKKRSKDGTAKALSLHGELVGKAAVIVDDMIDTGGTLAEAVRRLRSQGVEELYVCATHAIFSGEAVSRIAALQLQQIMVTDTMPVPVSVRGLKNLKVIPVAGLLADAVTKFHKGHDIIEEL